MQVIGILLYSVLVVIVMLYGSSRTEYGVKPSGFAKFLATRDDDGQLEANGTAAKDRSR